MTSIFGLSINLAKFPSNSKIKSKSVIGSLFNFLSIKGKSMLFIHLNSIVSLVNFLKYPIIVSFFFIPIRVNT